MNDGPHRHKSDEANAPAKLVAALAHLHREQVVVPPSVDEAILAEAKKYLGTIGRRRAGAKLAAVVRAVSLALSGLVEARRRNWLRLAPWAAASAAVLLATWLVQTVAKSGAAASAEDLNRDGQVDILDAFALARGLQHGETPSPRLDLNGDGVIDQRDVEVLAHDAVSLDRRRHS
jgi:hypothetical protein